MPDSLPAPSPLPPDETSPAMVLPWLQAMFVWRGIVVVTWLETPDRVVDCVFRHPGGGLRLVRWYWNPAGHELAPAVVAGMVGLDCPATLVVLGGTLTAVQTAEAVAKGLELLEFARFARLLERGEWP